MKVHEYQAKAVLVRYNVPVPNGEVATNPDEAGEVAHQLGGRVVVKAQVHAGGRGKAGGIQVVQSADEARQAASALLGKNLVTHQTGPLGVAVRKVLVEEPADVTEELYLGITVDGALRGPVMIASQAGGMNIEEIAATAPDRILKEPINPFIGFMPFQGRRLAIGLKVNAQFVRPMAQIMENMYKVFLDMDCSLVEINPLAVTDKGSVVALDAKLNLDDSALFRHPDLQELRDPEQEDPLEREASRLDISYVRLEGDVGCLVNGAGLAMATMDVIRSAGANPANFLDVGGGASEEKVAQAVGIMLSDPSVKRVLVNIFGGILRCDVAARGIVQAFKEQGASLPVVARMLGTNVEEGKAILETSGLDVTFSLSLAEVAQRINAVH